MDWIDKYITEMEAHGCTSLACICKELFYMHPLEERPPELPIWKEDLYLKKVDDYISHRSAIQSVYSSMDWVDGYIAKMEIHQSKNCFCLCDKNNNNNNK